MQILTHRGLEPNNKDYYPESSYEAFRDQLARGFGIEFDPNFAFDEIMVWHDTTLERLAKGRKVTSLDEVLDLIRHSNSKINALHLKSRCQNPRDLNRLIEILQKNKDILSKLLVFDVKIETAGILLAEFPEIQLAPSVTRKKDVFRYNIVTGGTLFEVIEAEKLFKKGAFGLYPWVWLDEWKEKLYTMEVFEKMRKAGARISLVSPELHKEESHPDAKNLSKLFKRIREIVALKPDAICTNYPEELAKL